MKENDIISGFRVIRVRDVPDLSGILFEFSHEKTGARLAWMKNNGENKLFSVAFKTTPSDDTGVFHILEHSVLGGSEKYPVKEPFLEMLKSSLNTFLNAMTFPDMTVFPVSSRNDADFMNLVGVYLDAVFHPLIYTEKRIFEQEGWHIEFKKENDIPKYKGVVFNEMKGALSSVNDRIMTELCRLLFPDNCYRFESGGDPDHIPELTYERFVETHRRFYSPSNAYFYIDGPVDIESLLHFIDRDYLSSFEKAEAVGAIQKHTLIDPITKILEYDLSPEQPLEENTYIAFGKIIGEYSEIDKLYAVSAISEALAGSNESPLKRALLDTGHCLDFSMGLTDGILQPFGIVEVMNTDEEYANEITKLICDKARDIVSEGVDKEALAAAIDRMEFRYREGSEPKGLDRDLNALTSWIHGGDPRIYLDCGWVFDKLREHLKTDYYEKLISEWLLHERGTARLIMIPSHEYSAVKKEQEDKRVADAVSSLDEKGKRSLISQNISLEKWQQRKDSRKALDSIPVLPLSAVSELPLKYETEVDESCGVTVLRHPAKERGITSVSLYFDVHDLSSEELFLLKIGASMLGELPTRDFTGSILRQKINSTFGDLYFTVDAYAREGVVDTCKPYFIVRGSFLDNKRNEAFELIFTILSETLYLPELIAEQLSQMQENYRQSIIGRGSAYALRRAMAPSSALSSFVELTAGYESYVRLGLLIKEFEKSGSSICDTFHSLMDKICCATRLTLGVTSFDNIDVNDIISRFEIGVAADKGELSFRLQVPDFSGIIIPSRIAFTAQSFAESVSDISSWRVLSSILSLEYLWNEIRVKGGAYGAGASVSGLGIVGFNSFRDPDAANSFNVYSGFHSFVDEFVRGVESLDKYIIGTIAKQEPLISDSSRGIGGDELYFRGITYEDRIKNRREILATSKDAIVAAAERLNGSVRRCVIAPENTVRSFEKNDIVINTL